MEESFLQNIDPTFLCESAVAMFATIWVWPENRASVIVWQGWFVNTYHGCHGCDHGQKTELVPQGWLPVQYCPQSASALDHGCAHHETSSVVPPQRWWSITPSEIQNSLRLPTLQHVPSQMCSSVCAILLSEILQKSKMSEKWENKFLNFFNTVQPWDIALNIWHYF